MYPMYGNMMPAMPTPVPAQATMPAPMPTPMPAAPMASGPMMTGQMMPGSNPGYANNYGPVDSNASLTAQVNNLEKRVARLEGMMSSNSTAPTYSESNFYMV